jgi:hypothetical protein
MLFSDITPLLRQLIVCKNQFGFFSFVLAYLNFYYLIFNNVLNGLLDIFITKIYSS